MKSRFPRPTGVITEWEFSRHGPKNVKQRLIIMNFEMESMDRHPFLFDDEKIKYREKQRRKKLNPEHVVGLRILAEHNNQKTYG